MKVVNNLALNRANYPVNKGTFKKNTKIQQNTQTDKFPNCLSFSANYNKVFVEYPIDVDKISHSGITNLHIIDNDCVRGETLSSKRNRKYLELMKECGIKNVIDLRDKYKSNYYEGLCSEIGLNYYNIPIDSSSIDDGQIIEQLGLLIEVLGEGKTYIACAQGLHRTDIALALDYVFSPKDKEIPVMYGHFRDNGFKSDDIIRRIRSVDRTIDDNEIKALGWDMDDFEIANKNRQQNLVEFNSRVSNYIKQ